MCSDPAPLPHERCDPNPAGISTGRNSYLLYIRSGSGARPDLHPGPQRSDSRVRDGAGTETSNVDERRARTVRVGCGGLRHVGHVSATDLPVAELAGCSLGVLVRLCAPRPISASRRG